MSTKLSLTRSAHAHTFKLNYKFQAKDARDLKHVAEATLLPTACDISPGLPAVKDQGALGSCVSNSAATCLEYCLLHEKVYYFDVSRLFIYYNGRLISGAPLDQDTGLDLRSASQALTKYSAPAEANWPYDISQFAVKPPDYAYTNALKHKKLTYLSVAADGIKACINEGYPVSIGISVYDSFMTQEVQTTGIVPMPDIANETLQGGHCLTLCAYDDASQMYTVRNSWGANWGLNQGPAAVGNWDNCGNAKIPYAYINDPSLASDFTTYRYFD